MNTIVMQIESAKCSADGNTTVENSQIGGENVTQVSSEGSQNFGDPQINSEIGQPLASTPNVNLGSSNITAVETGSKETSVISAIVTNPGPPVFSPNMFTEVSTESHQDFSKQEMAGSPVLTTNRILKNSEISVENSNLIQCQKVFNIMSTSQKNLTNFQKISGNNNNKIPNVLQKNVPSNLKLHVVNSKQNLGIKTPLQVQRQIVSNLSPKMISTKNHMLKGQQTLPNNVQKAYKTINRPLHNPKTIKTLSPQSPQNYLQKTGIKTLSPQNHLGKSTNSLKLLHNAANQVQRMGIKTLAPQRPQMLNNRGPNLPPKPNYIGKHAIQAHKVHKSHLGAKGRAPPRGSPTKYMQKGPQNTQSSFNQTLTAQILQSLPQTGRQEVYAKNYTPAPQVHSPTDSNLSDEIGEEVKPEMSSDVDYYYQLVMLDHNYSSSVGPAPTFSPRAPVEPMAPRESIRPHTTNVGPQISPIGVNGVPNVQSAPNYHYGSSGKRLRLNSGSSLPPSAPLNVNIPNPVSTDIQMQHDDDAASTISSETHREHPGEEGEETETAPEGEGDEDGITRCICDYDHDDGYMICCDICSSWQHVDCMGLDREHIPEKYACVRCEPRRVDRAHARAIQQRKREELAASDSNSSGSDTSTAESTNADQNQNRHTSISLNNNLVATKKRQNQPVITQRRKSEPIRRQIPTKRQVRQLREGRRTLKKREKKTVLKRKMKSRSSVDDDSQDSWPSPQSSNLLRLHQWIENYEEAVTNHYSPELRARISNMRANGQTHTNVASGVGVQAPPNSREETQVQKCKVLPQPLTGLKIVVANQSLGAESAVIELRGKYMLGGQHRQSGGGSGGLLTRQNSGQRPGPFLFFYRLPKDGTEVCVDTRTYGNDARFIRRSCRPNAELRHCVEKGTLHLYIVTTANVEKNQELTIRHEAHDLAASNTTTIPCACANPQSCNLLNRNLMLKNGHEIIPDKEITSQTHQTHQSQVQNLRKGSRRGRRTSSPALTQRDEPKEPPQNNKEPHKSATNVASTANNTTATSKTTNVAQAAIASQPPSTTVTTRRSSSTRSQSAGATAEKESTIVEKVTEKKSVEKTVDRPKSPEIQTAISGSNASSNTTSTSKDKDKSNKKKLTREERKMEAIMKAFERMEKQQARKQEVQARQAQRRESDPTPQSQSQSHSQSRNHNHNNNQNVESEEKEDKKEGKKRKKRKGRSRTISTSNRSSRRTRLNSTDSYLTSGDESLLSPPLEGEKSPLKSQGSQISDISSPGQVTTAAGLLLALASGGGTNVEKSPNRGVNNDNDNSSSSSIQSSPSTPLSSACLLVAAAVGPLEPGFKLPKTKKAIMNQWLSKSPPHTTTDPTPPPEKNLNALVQAASLCDSPPQANSPNPNQSKITIDSPPISKKFPFELNEKSGGGNAKKRWLRQAISEECDSPISRPDSPPSTNEMVAVAPPKKRRLARASLSSEQSFTPPTTPTMLVPPTCEEFASCGIQDEEFYDNDFKKGSKVVKKIPDSSRVEIVYPTICPDANEEASMDPPELEPDAVLKQRVADLRMEFSGSQMRKLVPLELSEGQEKLIENQNRPTPSILDPRLGRCDRPMFRDSAQLLGTVEKTLRFYEESFAQPPPVEEKKVEKKPEIVTPAKRKLSISEYRQRKQLSSTERTSIEENTQNSIPSEPGSPIRASRTRTDSSSSTSSLSSEEEISNINPIPIANVEPLDKTGTVVFNSAPTTVELQRENVERLKKVFGLESSTSRDSSTTSPKSILTSSPRMSPASIKSDIKTETTKYLLSLESKFSEMIYSETPKFPEENKFPEISSKLFEKIATSTKERQKIVDNVDKVDDINRFEIGEKIESRFDKIDKFKNVDRVDNVDRKVLNRFEFGETLDKLEKFEKIDDNIDKFRNVDKVDNVAKKLNRFENIEKVENFDKFEEIDKFRNVDRVDNVVKVDKFESTEKLEKIEKFEKFDNFDDVAKVDNVATVAKPIDKVVKVDPDFTELKFSETSEYKLHKISPKEEFSTDVVKTDIDNDNDNDNENEDFVEDDNFIPPFNNPVYPNSTQYTSYPSVIDTCPYEGRNPSPPPSEILRRLSPFNPH